MKVGFKKILFANGLFWPLRNPVQKDKQKIKNTPKTSSTQGGYKYFCDLFTQFRKCMF